jgi:hypothetical protein
LAGLGFITGVLKSNGRGFRLRYPLQSGFSKSLSGRVDLAKNE